MKEGLRIGAAQSGEGPVGAAVRGLSSDEVARRFEAGQYNRPPQSATKNIRRIFFDNIVSVFNVIIGLIVLFLLAFYVGTRDGRLLLDAVGVFSIALFNTAIAIFQEIKAKLALDKVNMLLTREVGILRDGTVSSIPQDQIVLDDVIAVKRGDQAVVDGRVIYSNHMEIDESLLTGESVPVEKVKGDTILSGSFCLSGNGYYVVTELSDSSYAAKLTRSAQQLKIAVSPLQRHINRIVMILFVVALLLCLLEGSRSIYQKQVDADFARRLATILIGLVPQGLVLMASVTFAIGVYRISKVGAIVQAFNAVESFANVEVICMDKTGTLTQNRMTVREVTTLAEDLSSDAIENLLGTYARLSSDKNATIRALESFKADSLCQAAYEVPFSSQRKMSALSITSRGQEVVYVLGAFEVIMDHCHDEAREMSLEIFSKAKLDVYRNLLFGVLVNPEAIDRRSDNLGLIRVNPLCVVSLSDTVRTDVCDVIKGLEPEGIRFKILSGDSATSILATCRDIGWNVTDEDIITGADLDALEAEQLARIVDKRVVFARLKPEHKVKIIKALRASNIHTAMIGDGVNDVPAIKQADLGLAMDEGASITKEVADIILLENRFTLLPEVFEEGKKIINTVGSVAKLFLTKNFMVVYLTLISALLLWDFPLTPRRVSLINIFAIGLPAMIIALTNSNTDRPKRFVLDMISFVAISALVIVASGYVGSYLVRESGRLSGVDSEVAHMVMLSIMIVISVLSFLIVAVGGGRKRRGTYILYGACMTLVYFLAASSQSGNRLVRLIRTFYEISPMSGIEWRIVIVVCVIGGLLLVAAQKLRTALVNR